ncbi:beta family protein [Pseudomonas sp. RIT-PI-S]|uniref:beta family protein n=1 Tax=Pseudomonas sp. RIT-PI-S TaxID=3035295 RepID=UPI0021DA5DD5|nr:beta family protein [Pseudomonas sp. RIT-PI-S]
MFDHRQYVPVLKWRQGEYLALARMSDALRERITPLLEIPAEAWDYEHERPQKSIDEHISLFGRRLMATWGSLPCFVDSCYLPPDALCADGTHHFERLLELAAQAGCMALPVTGLTRHYQYQAATARIVRRDGRGLCLRLISEDFDHPALATQVGALLAYMGLAPAQVDLVIDFSQHIARSATAQAGHARALLAQTPQLARWRSLTLIGTSFPAQVTPEDVCSSGVVRRYEWLAYKLLLKRLEARERRPAFGDYTIAHPQTGLLDPRLNDVPARIEYTVADGWLLMQGTEVKRDGREQYRLLCQRVLGSGQFDGECFSWGDDYLYQCAELGASTGSASTFTAVGNNHHLTRVVLELANFHAL